MEDDTDRLISDPALLRGLTQRRISRRDALKYGGMGTLTAFLAACGVSGTRTSERPAVIDFNKIYGKGKTGVLNFANWPDYIDYDANGKIATLEKFTKATGIKVNYKEVIPDNETFLPKILPSLRAGQYPGYDLIIITNGTQLNILLESNYLTPLDHRFLKNFKANVSPTFKGLAYDPGNRYTTPWQSGLTGIGWNTKKIKRPITSFFDLFDPEFKGKVGFFKNLQDYPNGTLVGMGKNPASSTPADWQKAADVIAQHRDSGQFRNFYDQTYIDALEAGDIWITQAWSGDIQIARLSKDEGGDGYPEMRFAEPKEGSLFWTDNMCIPAHAQNPVDAITFMDFVYQPQIAAGLTDYIQYISPVPAAQQILAAEDPPVAKNHEVFPTAQDLSHWFPYRVFRNHDEEERWNGIFGPVTA